VYALIVAHVLRLTSPAEVRLLLNLKLDLLDSLWLHNKKGETADGIQIGYLRQVISPGRLVASKADNMLPRWRSEKAVTRAGHDEPASGGASRYVERTPQHGR
jgi:hypothetical protein